MSPSHADGAVPLPSFADLLAGYADGTEEPSMPAPVSLSAVLAGDDDPLRIIGYLSGLGLTIQTLDDLLAINEDDREEELHAFRCREGIALSIASDGLWLLFVP